MTPQPDQREEQLRLHIEETLIKLASTLADSSTILLLALSHCQSATPDALFRVHNMAKKNQAELHHLLANLEKDSIELLSHLATKKTRQPPTTPIQSPERTHQQ